MFNKLYMIVEKELGKKTDSSFKLEDLETIFEIAIDIGNDEGEVLGYKKCLEENFYGEDQDEDEIRDEAYREGHCDGHNDGHEEGYNNGHSDGYLKGKEEGMEDEQNNNYKVSLKCYEETNIPF